MDALLSGYERMRDLAVKAASYKAPEVVLEKVASIPQRASASVATNAADALVKSGFAAGTERERLIRNFCVSTPDEICGMIEKWAARAIPLEQNFDHRLESRGGVSDPSEYSNSSNQAWIEAAKSSKNKQ